MRRNLTRRQAEVLEVTRSYIDEHGISPTLEEIGEILGVNRVTVFEHVRALEDKGWITTEKNYSRSIQLTDDLQTPAPRSVPLLGRIAAGSPIEALEDRQSVELDDFFPHGGNCFMLEVQGDSMIDDQIRDGDLVLVESRKTAHAGETVVALIDGEEATLKRFYRQGRRIRLEPRNESLKPIVLDARRVEVQGIVIGVLRRY
jgi:repressor LexA